MGSQPSNNQQEEGEPLHIQLEKVKQQLHNLILKVPQKQALAIDYQVDTQFFGVPCAGYKLKTPLCIRFCEHMDLDVEQVDLKLPNFAVHGAFQTVPQPVPVLLIGRPPQLEIVAQQGNILPWKLAMLVPTKNLFVSMQSALREVFIHVPDNVADAMDYFLKEAKQDVNCSMEMRIILPLKFHLVQKVISLYHVQFDVLSTLEWRHLHVQSFVFLNKKQDIVLRDPSTQQLIQFQITPAKSNTHKGKVIFPLNTSILMDICNCTYAQIGTPSPFLSIPLLFQKQEYSIEAVGDVNTDSLFIPYPTIVATCKTPQQIPLPLHIKSIQLEHSTNTGIKYILQECRVRLHDLVIHFPDTVQDGNIENEYKTSSYESYPVLPYVTWMSLVEVAGLKLRFAQEVDRSWFVTNIAKESFHFCACLQLSNATIQLQGNVYPYQVKLVLDLQALAGALYIFDDQQQQVTKALVSGSLVVSFRENMKHSMWPRDISVRTR